MSKLTDGERIVAVETKLDIVIEQVKSTNEKLDLALPTFQTTEEAAKDKHELQRQITDLRRAKWTSNILTAILTAVLVSSFGYIMINIFK